MDGKKLILDDRVKNLLKYFIENGMEYQERQKLFQNFSIIGDWSLEAPKLIFDTRNALNIDPLKRYENFTAYRLCSCTALSSSAQAINKVIDARLLSPVKLVCQVHLYIEQFYILFFIDHNASQALFQQCNFDKLEKYVNNHAILRNGY